MGEEALGGICWSELQGPFQNAVLHQKPFGATKLESEMEPRGSGATAVEQHLLQAETPRKNGQGGRTLRWFTTVALNAAFLGMVRAEAETTCMLCGLCAALLKLPGPRENGYNFDQT